MHRVAIELTKKSSFHIDSSLVAKTGINSLSLQSAILLEEIMLNNQKNGKDSPEKWFKTGDRVTDRGSDDA